MEMAAERRRGNSMPMLTHRKIRRHSRTRRIDRRDVQGIPPSRRNILLDGEPPPAGD
jgi:hypothetical protein